MESFLAFVCEYSHEAHWIFFLLLLLAGCNLPFSEDLIAITGGIIVATCIPDHMLKMWLWIYAGSCMGAWVAYSIGRFIGPKLYKIKWFKRFASPERIDKLHYYYEKFGIFTFIAIRFFPGGVRNAFAMSCGLSKMTFLAFALRDELAAAIQITVLFFLGHAFAQNYELLFKYVREYNVWGLGLIVLAIVIVICYNRYKKNVSAL